MENVDIIPVILYKSDVFLVCKEKEKLSKEQLTLPSAVVLKLLSELLTKN